MRKYYVIEIAEGDKKIAGKGIYEYATENEAIATFHKKLGTAMGSELFTSDLVMVIDDNGAVLKVEKYVSDTPAPSEDILADDILL